MAKYLDIAGEIEVGTLTADFLQERTTGDGLLIDGVLLKDGGATIADGGVLSVLGSGTGTGDVVQRIGASATEGLELVVFEATIEPAAIETAVVTVPAGALLMSVQSNVETALTGGGTTDSYALGVAADPDLFGSSATLTQNSKTNLIVGTVTATAIPILLTGTASETADGDTALTVGSVRVRVVYWQANSLDDAAA